MEVDSEPGRSAPNYSNSSNVDSQSKRAPKNFNMEFTSTAADITHEEFIALQLKLIKMIIKATPGAVFKVKTGDEDNDFLDVSLEHNPAFNPPVKEIFFRNKRKNLISILPFSTTLSPHEMKRDQEVGKFLEDNKFGLRRHHWFTNEVDIARPFYILTQDPRFLSQYELLQKLDIPEALVHDLVATDIRIVPAHLH